MRTFNSGYTTRVVVALAATALVMGTVLYAAGEILGVRPGLSVVAMVGMLLAFFWALGRVRRQGEGLRHRALYDPMTGLPNRRLFVECTDRALTKAAGGSFSVAVLLVDLDDFEEINRGLGYEAGDRLLAFAAQRIGESARSAGGIAARLCSDEFAVLLGDVPTKAAAVVVAKRIGEDLGSPMEVDGNDVFVSASVGVAVGGPGQDNTPERMLRDADIAMHAAKRKGKARHRLFEPDADSTTSKLSLSESEMRRAVEHGEFKVFYQPLVALKTGEVRGVEALVRWQHPVLGLVSPGEFVPVAEQTGLIVPIGRWVLQEACRQVRLWQEKNESNPPLALSVNVSARQFRQPNLAKEILATLKRAGLDACHLTLEITESVMVHDASAADALQELKGFGVKVAMDDFGTGYSNLSYVKRLPIDVLKIDRSYVEGLGGDSQDTAIVHATVAFAKALGLKVVAEGIENAEQLACLEELGCDLGQGYLFAKPLPGEEVPRFLAARPRTAG